MITSKTTGNQLKSEILGLNMIQFSVILVFLLGFVTLGTSAPSAGALGDECYADCDCYEDADNTACYFLQADKGICWCKPGLVYDNETRTCVFDCCTLPNAPNGRFVLDTGETMLGASAKLKCCDGYMTSADIIITCTEDGWDEAGEDCVLKDCGTPPTIDNGRYILRGNSLVGGTAVLECDDSFTADSIDTCLACTTDGMWTAPVAQCIKNCGVPPPTPNGYYTLDTGALVVGATATLKCCDKFSTTGDVQIGCTDDGWTEGSMECIQVVQDCPNSDWIKEGSSCYLFGDEALTYNSARTLCSSFNGNLVQIDSQAELAFVKRTMNNQNPQPLNGFWNDLFEVSGVNGQERWRTSNDPLIVSDWNQRSSQPSDFNGVKQACTAFWRAFQYEQADIECTNDVTGGQDGRLNHALCEINIEPS